MNQWEVFVMDVAELAEDTDLELTIRTLNPGVQKYTYKRVKAHVSSALDKFADQLQVRLGR
ncbi:MAG: phenylphosphate carboxylase subunit gamma, partial [Rhodocyclales bacterium]|nr:phenylphosphate carboxylase subunit gamma [Rhodocyclales bacterium]